MLQCNAGHAVPTEVGFRRQQIFTEVLRDEAAYHIGQACQNQNPCKKEMIRPVPNRGTDDHRNGKINEGRGCETAGFAPVQARVTYENADAAHQQANDAEHDDPVRDTNQRDMARHCIVSIAASTRASLIIIRTSWVSWDLEATPALPERS